MSTGRGADILPDSLGAACAPQHPSGGLILTRKLADPSETPTDRQNHSILQPHVTLNSYRSPGRIVPLVRASSQYAKAVGSIPGQDTYENQPKNA